MNMQFRAGAEQAASADVKTAIADCDIHPARATATELYPYLAKRLACASRDLWQACLSGHDGRPAVPPQAQPNASRRDAYPPEGGPQVRRCPSCSSSISIRITSRWAC